MSTNKTQVSEIIEGFQEMKAGYKGDIAAYGNLNPNTDYARKRKAPGVGVGADYSLDDYKLSRFRELVRAIDTDDVIVGPAIDKAINNIVQTGFDPDPQTDSADINSLIKEYWQNWATNPDLCDVSGRHTFADFEFLVERHKLVDGDCFVLPVMRDPVSDLGHQLQLLEAHLCATPQTENKNIVLGVEMDQYRRPTRYWFRQDSIDPHEQQSVIKSRDAYNAEDGSKNVFHIYDPERASQTRGMSVFHRLIYLLSMVEDINFAKLVQQQICSFFAIFHKFNANSPVDKQDLSFFKEPLSAQPGMELWGRDGEEIEGFSPSIPNAEFFQHIRLELMLIADALGLPLCAMLLDASETNFSGFRGALDQAKLGFRRQQNNLVNRFHTHVYRLKLKDFAQHDDALGKYFKKNPDNYFKHVWNKPTWPFIQPLDDAKANKIRLDSLQISPSGLASELGRDWEKTANETVRDNSLLIRKALEEADALNSEFGSANLTWRDIICINSGSSLGASVGQADGTKDEGSNAAKN